MKSPECAAAAGGRGRWGGPGAPPLALHHPRTAEVRRVEVSQPPGECSQNQGCPQASVQAPFAAPGLLCPGPVLALGLLWAAVQRQAASACTFQKQVFYNKNIAVNSTSTPFVR